MRAAREGLVLPLATAAATVVPSSPIIARGSSVLLSEPVVIIQGSQAAASELPRGTRVQVLRADGRFVRVQHAHNTVTIPRTATLSSASASYF